MAGLSELAADQHGIPLHPQGPGLVFHCAMLKARRRRKGPITSYRDYVRRHDAPRWAHLRRCLLEEGVRAIERGLWFISLAHTQPTSTKRCSACVCASGGSGLINRASCRSEVHDPDNPNHCRLRETKSDINALISVRAPMICALGHVSDRYDMSGQESGLQMLEMPAGVGGLTGGGFHEFTRGKHGAVSMNVGAEPFEQ
jgi:hypothetical protein